ncbi:hypothetical protein V2E24_00335 [Mycoplasmopsis ciconiae]|uniref:Uncharacterized protein n=1 Tax=Mycoplasmopsis ciconiae TaxID=561067 RepID=A0ABU7MKQ5_9BACT|nr:hypothetical protein [Mycoplasmopsis ciconiae]
MNKKNKALTATAISALALSAGAGAFLFNLSEKSQVKDVIISDTSRFEFLNQKIKQIYEKIQDPNLTEEEKIKLLELAKEAQEILDNSNSTYTQAYNKAQEIDFYLNSLELQKGIEQNNVTEISKALDELANMINDPNIKEEFEKNTQTITDKLKDPNISTKEKDQLYQDYINALDDALNNQSNIQKPLVDNLNKIDNLLNQDNNFLSVEDKAVLKNYLKEAEEKLTSTSLSAQDVQVLSKNIEEVFNLMLNKNTSSIEDINAFNKKIEQAIVEISNAQLPQEQKDKLLSEITQIKAQANTTESVFGVSKQNDISVLDEQLKGVLNHLSDAFLTKEELIAKLNKVFDSNVILNNVPLNQQYKNYINAQKQMLNDLLSSTNKDETQIKNALLDLLLQTTKDQITAKALDQAIDQMIDKATEAKNTNLINRSDLENIKSDLSSFDVSSLEEAFKEVQKLLGNDAIVLQRSQQLNTNIDQLQKELETVLTNSINPNLTLANSIKQQIAQLKTQNRYSLSVLEQQQNKFLDASNDLKDLEKQILNELINEGDNLVQNSYLPQSLKDRINQLKIISKPLANSLSGSTRNQLVPRIEQYKELISQASVYKIYDKVEKQANDLKQKTSDLLSNSPREQEAAVLVEKQIDQILDNIEATKNNLAISDQQKEQQIQQASDALNNIDSKLADVKNLSTLEQSILDEINSDKDQDEKAILTSQIERIKNIIQNNSNAYAHLNEEYDFEAVAKQLNDLFQEYLKDKNELIKQRTYNSILRHINNTFAPLRFNGQNTPMQQSFINELNKLQEHLNDPNVSDEIFDEYRQKMIDLDSRVENAYLFEVAANNLNKAIDVAQSYTYGQYEPTTAINQAKATAQNASEIFEKAQGGDFLNAEEFLEKQQQLENELAQLKLAQAQSLLKFAASKLTPYLYTDTNSNAALSEIINVVNSNINSVINDAFELANNPQANIEELKSFSEKVENTYKLASVLNGALLTYQSQANDPKYDLVFERYKDVILSNLLNTNDSLSEIGAKIRNIDAETSKITPQKNVIDNLILIKQVYPNTFISNNLEQQNSNIQAQRVFYRPYISELNAKISEYQETFSDKNLSVPQLIELNNNIIDTTLKAQSTKEDLTNKWNNLTQEVETTYQNYRALSTQLSFNTPIMDKYYNEVYLSAKESLETTFDDLNQINTDLIIAYWKDKFDNQYTKLKLDIEIAYPDNSDPIFSATIAAKTDLLESLEFVNNLVHPENITPKLSDAELKEKESQISALFVNNQISVLQSIEAYSKQALKLIQKINEYNNNQDENANSLEALSGALQANRLSKVVVNSSSDLDVIAQIQTLIDNLNEAYRNNISFNDYKNESILSVNELIKKYEAQINEANVSSYPLNFKEEQIDYLTNLSNEIESIEYTQNTPQEILAARNKVKQLMDRYDQIANNFLVIDELAQQVKLVTDTVGAKVENDKTNILSMINNDVYNLVNNQDQPQNSITNQYTNPNSTQISQFISELKSLQNIYYSAVKYTQSFENLQAEFNKIAANNDYPNGLFYESSVQKQKFQDYISAFNKKTLNIDENGFISNLPTSLTLDTAKAINDQSIALIKEQITQLTQYNIINNEASGLYTWDAKNVADSILNSVLVIPSNNQWSNVSDIRQIINTMKASVSKKFNLFTSRKEAVENITTKLNSLDNSSNVYSILNQKYTQKYNELKEQILSAQSEISNSYPNTQQENQYIIEISQIINDLNRMANNLFNVYPLYKNIAEAINLQKQQIAQVQLNPNISDSNNVINPQALAQLNAMIANVEKVQQAYTKETNEAQLKLIQTNILALTQKSKVVTLYAELFTKLTKDVQQTPQTSVNIQTNKFNLAQNQYTNLIAQPLFNILQEFITQANDSANFDVEKLINLQTRYLNGDAPSSFKVALANTNLLINSINEAVQYSNTKAQNETVAMNDLYTQLGTLNSLQASILSQAYQALVNVNRNEISKTNAINSISNDFNGILVRLQRQKYTEVQNQLSMASALNSYLNANYQSKTKSATPVISSYVSEAIDNLKALNINTPISQMNEQINISYQKMKQQIDAVYEYEKANLNAQIANVQKYLALYGKMSVDSIDSSQANVLKQMLNISEEALNSLLESVNNTSNNAQLPTNQAELTKFYEQDYQIFILNNLKTPLQNLTSSLESFRNSTLLSATNIKNGFENFNQQLSTNSLMENGQASLLMMIEAILWNSQVQNNDYLPQNYEQTFTLIRNFTSNYATNKESLNFDNLSQNFDDYQTFILNLYKVFPSLQEMIFNQNGGLKNTYSTYLNSRKNISTFLNTVAGQNYRSTDINESSPFSEFLNSYNTQTATAESVYTQTFEQISQNSSISRNLLNLNIAITSLYNFKLWLQQIVNISQIFNYLNENHADTQTPNYLYSDIKEDVIAEKFIESFEAIKNYNANEQERAKIHKVLNIAGKNYNSVLINPNRGSVANISAELENLANNLKNLFNEFSILNQPNFVYNLENIRIYLYAFGEVGSANENDYLQAIFQTNSNYKAVKYNIAFEYVNPFSVSAPTQYASVFGDLPNFIFNYDNVQTYFKTVQYLKVTKDNLPFYGRGDRQYLPNAEMYSVYNQITDLYPQRAIFKYTEAGWSPQTAVTNLFTSFVNYSNKGTNNWFLTDFSNAAVNQSTSTQDFNIKIKPKLPDGKITLDGVNYRIYKDWTFWSTIQPDNQGTIAWMPITVAIPLISEDNSKIGWITYMFQLTTYFDSSKPNNFTTFNVVANQAVVSSFLGKNIDKSGNLDQIIKDNATWIFGNSLSNKNVYIWFNSDYKYYPGSFNFNFWTTDTQNPQQTTQQYKDKFEVFDINLKLHSDILNQK